MQKIAMIYVERNATIRSCQIKNKAYGGNKLTCHNFVRNVMSATFLQYFHI